MITHIVLLRLRPEVSEAAIGAVFAEVHALQGSLPGLRRVISGRSASPEQIERGYLHGMVVTLWKSFRPVEADILPKAPVDNRAVPSPSVPPAPLTPQKTVTPSNGNTPPLPPNNVGGPTESNTNMLSQILAVLDSPVASTTRANVSVQRLTSLYNSILATQPNTATQSSRVAVSAWATTTW